MGNAYVLGGQTREVKNDLGEKINELEKDGKETNMEIKDIKKDIRSLIRRQNELEVQTMAHVEKLVVDCGKKR